MHVLITLLGLLLLIPAALAGISSGLRDLSANRAYFMTQMEQLLTLGHSLWPACCALALVLAGVLTLAACLWIMARGLQSRT